MIRVQIGTSERRGQITDSSWINEQINRRLRDGQSVCVRIQIEVRGQA